MLLRIPALLSIAEGSFSPQCCGGPLNSRDPQQHRGGQGSSATGRRTENLNWGEETNEIDFGSENLGFLRSLLHKQSTNSKRIGLLEFVRW